MQAEGGELRAEVREPGRTTGREDENDYHHKFRKQPLRAMPAPEKYVHDCGLEPKLLELVKMRVADQRLRILYRHAFQRSAAARRNSSGSMR